jgi:hypothetical protein
VLTSLGSSFGMQPQVELAKTLLDGSVQWGQAGNIRYNAQLWSLLAKATRRV